MITAMIIALTGLILFITATLTETALTSCNRLRIELDIKQEKSYAIFAERLLENKVLLLWSFKFFRSVMAAVATVAFAALALDGGLTGDMNIYLKSTIVIIISALVIILIGTLLPKWIASMYPDVVLMKLYWFALFVSKVTSPLSVRRAGNPSMIIAEEEEESAEAEIIHNAINFPDVLLRECMIPRTEVVAISSEATPEDTLSLFRDSNYSRIPVFEGNIDRITGYIHSKDLLTGKKSAGELRRQRRNRSVRRRGRKLTKRLCAAVACGVNSVRACFTALVRLDVSVFIKLCDLGKYFVLRLLAYCDKEPVKRKNCFFTT